VKKRFFKHENNMNENVTQDENIETEFRAFTVSSDFINTRLDVFLASQIQDWSRSRLQHLIVEGSVRVNRRRSKPSYQLRDGDEIEVRLALPLIENFTPEDIPLNIIYEDDAIIVINKPAGLVVHPAPGTPSGTLANAVGFHIEKGEKEEKERADYESHPHSSISYSSLRPGIVHRLDKGTSGLIVVAKTESVREKLAKQFHDREVFKSYVALVHGVVQQETGRIEEPIARDMRNRKRMGVVQGGRNALSLYRVRKRFEKFTLLDIEIKTGRTHQIRVHLAHINHPIVGDETYNDGRDKTIVDVEIRTAIAKLNRVFLHAEQLGFYHPTTNEWIKFKAEMPDELSQLLNEMQKAEGGRRN
jgi:23S rRNA pseudouridine1911/1915/1917 synthase